MGRFNVLRRSLIITALGACGFSAQAQTVWRFSNWLPPTHHVITEMIQPWAADVEKATEGRVTRARMLDALTRIERHLAVKDAP